MSIMLKGDEGYYSRVVEFEGVKFRVRELEDDEFKAHLVAAQDVTKIARGDVAPEEVLHENLVAELIRQAPGRVVEIISAMRAAMDLVIVPGIVSWDLDRECTPETRRALPPPVKLRLAQAIIADTTLSQAEEAFLPVSPGTSL